MIVEQLEQAREGEYNRARAAEDQRITFYGFVTPFVLSIRYLPGKPFEDMAVSDQMYIARATLVSTSPVKDLKCMPTATHHPDRQFRKRLLKVFLSENVFELKKSELASNFAELLTDHVVAVEKLAKDDRAPYNLAGLVQHFRVHSNTPFAKHSQGFVQRLF